MTLLWRVPLLGMCSAICGPPPRIAKIWVEEEARVEKDAEVSNCGRPNTSWGLRFAARNLHGCCCCYTASFLPYTTSEWSYRRTRLLSFISVQNSWSMLKCFPFNRMCTFLQLLSKYLINKVICFIDRWLTHHYHLFVWTIMNICDLTELGTGNPSLLLSLIIVVNELFTQSQNKISVLHVRPGSITVQVKPLF